MLILTEDYMERYLCSGCKALCSQNFSVEDTDGKHYYCGRIGYCMLSLKRHRIVADKRRLDAGVTCSYLIPGSNNCGRDSVNIFPHPVPSEGRCKIHADDSLPVLPIQFHAEQVFV